MSDDLLENPIPGATYNDKTDSTFIKYRSIVPITRPYGQVRQPKKWARERIQNEADALQFIALNTTIPVPRVLDVKHVEDGSYLELEKMEGVLLPEVGDRRCHLPNEPGHQFNWKCFPCKTKAREIATKFITELAIPQLNALKAKQTGLGGIVIPPPWVEEAYHDRPRWEPKTSTEEEFVFCHGDLAAHNIMCDPDTLQVSYLFDWEHAGYFPREFQVWAVDRVVYENLFADVEKIARYVSLIEP